MQNNIVFTAAMGALTSSIIYESMKTAEPMPNEANYIIGGVLAGTALQLLASAGTDSKNNTRLSMAGDALYCVSTLYGICRITNFTPKESLVLTAAFVGASALVLYGLGGNKPATT